MRKKGIKNSFNVERPAKRFCYERKGRRRRNVRKDEGTKGPEEISNLKIFPNHDPCLLVGDLDDLEEFTHAGEGRRRPL
jgi:hypothetical protein